MTRSRISRKARQRDKTRLARPALIALAVLGSAAIVAGAFLGIRALADTTRPSGAADDASTQVIAIPQPLLAEETSTAPLPQDAMMVEVPDVAGKPLLEAEVVLEAAGLRFELALAGDAAAASPGNVITQEPAGGAIVAQGTHIVLGVHPDDLAAHDGSGHGYIVCIDPGHQAKSDLRQEPIGPGATETKDRVRGGATGVATRMPEYELVLQISMNLKARLEAAGVTVVMVRETNDVNISNSERATMANEAGADLFVRVHADGSTDSNIAGLSVLYPGKNQWTGPIVEPSVRAATAVHDATVAATGAVSRGTVARTDLSGFNWSKVPAILVECGFVTNPVEDKLLASPHYQDKLAEGMTNGILTYLKGQ